MKNSASVFPFSQHYFYGVNLPNNHKIVYYEEDETTKWGKQGGFFFLKKKHLYFRSLTERMAIFFKWKVLLLFFLFMDIFYVFCFRMDKERAAALGAQQLSPCGAVPLAAASVSGQEPHGMFWLQGGKAGKIPKCIKANFQPKFRPRFPLIPNLEGFH